jgi:FkbM family methyltransferase
MLLDILTIRKGIAWTINGESFLIDPHSRHRLGRDYDAPVAKYLCQRVCRGSICFDVGANVGVYVLQFARWSAPNGKVVAFEPNSAARAVLEKHIRLNELQSRVQVVASAVGAAEGTDVLHRAGADGMSRLRLPNRLIAEQTTSDLVPVTTLDVFCAKTGIKPDFVLIDIEGFEFSALRGAEDVLHRGRGQLELIVEMHPDLWDSADTTRSDAEAWLREIRLNAVPLTGQTDPLGEHGIVRLAYY